MSPCHYQYRVDPHRLLQSKLYDVNYALKTNRIIETPTCATRWNLVLYDSILLFYTSTACFSVKPSRIHTNKKACKHCSNIHSVYLRWQNGGGVG